MSLNICVPFDQASQSTSQMDLYQQTAPFLFYGSIASGIAWMAVYILPDWLSKLFSTRPMTGIPELKRCHQVLVKYMGHTSYKPHQQRRKSPDLPSFTRIWKRYAVFLTNKIFRIPISTMMD